MMHTIRQKIRIDLFKIASNITVEYRTVFSLSHLKCQIVPADSHYPLLIISPGRIIASQTPDSVKNCILDEFFR